MLKVYSYEFIIEHIYLFSGSPHSQVLSIEWKKENLKYILIFT